MAASKNSMGAKADKAFVRLVKNREKFGFPMIKSEGEVADNWHVVYSMPHRTIDEVRQDAKLLMMAFGNIPWKYMKNVG